MNTGNSYVDIILPLAIQGTYTYRVPESMPCPQVGTRVLVPLARKQAVGIVLSSHNAPIYPSIRLRDIIQALDPFPILTAEQIKLWQWIADYYLCPLGDVMAAALPAKALDHHYSMADSTRRRVKLPVFTDEQEPIHPLTQAQQKAYEDITQQFTCHDTVLLQGVTSSGKTEVYIHLIADQLAQGHQVLYLVPEIALTTQLTDRLQHVFGSQLRVYHSRISDAQRMEIYRQQRLDPHPRLIVGARSAIFLPFENLGLIIVDEEHETSYKQQEPAPRYHARSVAIVMAQYARAHILLGTATPSVESRYNAECGKYGYVTLTQRYQGLQLPHITLIDLKQQYHRKEMYGHFSDPLVERIRTELQRGKQIILFQNRRGYAPYLQCTQCGTIAKCPDCDVALTLHRTPYQLTCHYCGATLPVPATCPECGGEMKQHGFGTERLEEEIQQLFPEARVARMDLDTTRKKDDYQNIITSFSQHQVDILIGTQMVTKGLHFDDVSLVAVLNADHLLAQPDFRSYERAYQMLEQVSGRAGRKGEQGEVIIQTFDPTNPVFTFVCQHATDEIYRNQITERQTFHFPPFHRQISIILRHTDQQRLLTAVTLLQQRLQQAFGTRITDIITPSVARVQRLHIRQLNLRIEQKASIHRAKSMLIQHIQFIESLPACRGVQILIDVDPL
ncbi:MAG: primosomal protein N' [Paludibacteraceae bacterium]|nr:primosomal protein N' [Paludibacteraceae bacterium]